MQEKNIQVISYYDEDYPQQLKNLYDAPIVIYAIGNYKILNDQNKIAVIGARKASNYGINIARQIGKFLSKNNIHTISGLALGIDVNSHIGVLTENYINSYSGKAIAVIGNGLDNIYPYNNQEIANRIINNGGCIISEYIVGTKPLRNNFPARNRIISALSDKLVVVEAENEKSGTMITVDFSLELGKEIYVVPLFSFSASTTTNLSDRALIILFLAGKLFLNGLVPTIYSEIIHPPLFIILFAIS